MLKVIVTFVVGTVAGAMLYQAWLIDTLKRTAARLQKKGYDVKGFTETLADALTSLRKEDEADRYAAYLGIKPGQLNADAGMYVPTFAETLELGKLGKVDKDIQERRMRLWQTSRASRPRSFAELKRQVEFDVTETASRQRERANGRPFSYQSRPATAQSEASVKPQTFEEVMQEVVNDAFKQAAAREQFEAGEYVVLDEPFASIPAGMALPLPRPDELVPSYMNRVSKYRAAGPTRTAGKLVEGAPHPKSFESLPQYAKRVRDWRAGIQTEPQQRASHYTKRTNCQAVRNDGKPCTNRANGTRAYGGVEYAVCGHHARASEFAPAVTTDKAGA